MAAARIVMLRVWFTFNCLTTWGIEGRPNERYCICPKGFTPNTTDRLISDEKFLGCIPEPELTGGEIAGIVVGTIVGTTVFAAGWYALAALVLAGRFGAGKVKADYYQFWLPCLSYSKYYPNQLQVMMLSSTSHNKL